MRGGHGPASAELVATVPLVARRAVVVQVGVGAARLGIPPYAATQAYVARVTALAGQAEAIAGAGSAVVLVRAGGLLA